MNIAARLGMWSGGKVPTVKDYYGQYTVFFDAIENNGLGSHLDDIGTWKSCGSENVTIGNTRYNDDKSMFVHTRTSMSLANRKRYMPDKGATFSFLVRCNENASNVHTISLEHGINESVDAKKFTITAQSYPNRSYRYMECKISGSEYFSTGKYANDWNKLDFVTTPDGSGNLLVSYYCNGINIRNKSIDISSLNFEDSKYFGGWPSIYPNNYFRTITVANEAFTAEQIAYNYAIDKARFGLT